MTILYSMNRQWGITRDGEWQTTLVRGRCRAKGMDWGRMSTRKEREALARLLIANLTRVFRYRQYHAVLPMMVERLAERMEGVSAHRWTISDEALVGMMAQWVSESPEAQERLRRWSRDQGKGRRR